MRGGAGVLWHGCCSFGGLCAGFLACGSTRYFGVMVLAQTRKKILVLSCLTALISTTIGIGIYLKHYYAASAFLAWVLVEILLKKMNSIDLFQKVRALRKSAATDVLIQEYRKNTLEADQALEELILELKRDTNQTRESDRFSRHLRALSTFRALQMGRTSHNHKVKTLRAGFTFSKAKNKNFEFDEKLIRIITLQDLMDSAMATSENCWEVFDASLSDVPWVQKEAQALLSDSLGFAYQREKTSAFLERLTDCMKRDYGLPFFILNLISHGKYEATKTLGESLLTSRFQVEEELRSVLYWVTEIHWFLNRRQEPLKDHESIIRHLYHLCFTNPERGGFLEIDSQFFSEFETLNELAREAFVFKDDLIESILLLWKDYEGFFDSSLKKSLETLTGHHSKIHEDFKSWELFWSREGENLSKEYLYLVEGNLSFKSGDDEEAQIYFEKALSYQPTLRPALFNLLFVYARLENSEAHRALIDQILSVPQLKPSSYYVIGNSFELMGNLAEADHFYKKLTDHPTWENKADYIRSQFCFQHGLIERALKFATAAQQKNPNDSSIKYHLSLCYNAVGENSRALDLIQNFGEAPIWMDYYRFKLQRDAGLVEEASKTLLNIPTSYFEDEEELEEAIEFAKDENNLTLLRHLKHRS